jgi:cysteine desulfurase family protein
LPIYLDNAATSFPKPECVYRAVDKFCRTQAVSIGRGNYQRANNASRLVSQTRTKIAGLINAPNPKNISFCYSGTDSLCTAIFGFLKPGDHVIATAAEHTSVLRPLNQLELEKKTSVSLVGLSDSNSNLADQVGRLITKDTKLVCVNHASNVTGEIAPIEEISQLCDQRNVRLLIDAAQTIGHLPIDVQSCPCDFLCAPGHKALLAPLGTGILYVADRVAEATSPFRLGGTGSTHVDENQPSTFPEKFESGNMNGPGIAGLSAALDWLNSEDAKAKAKKLDQQIQILVKGLNAIDGVTVYGPNADVLRAPVVSFSVRGIDCHTVGMMLDSQFEIECRTGLHCAPMLHKSLSTAEQGGLVRFSPGLFTTDEEVKSAIAAVQQIAKTS